MAFGAGDDLVMCWAVSALAGLGAGFFSCVLSVSDKQRQRAGGKYTRRSLTQFIIGIVGSTLFGMGSLMGLAFGPIATVTVVRAGTTLPANAVFSQMMGLRPLVRDDYLGTLTCICGVVCFANFQGVPALFTDDMFMDYISRSESIAWVVGLLVLMLGAFLSLSYTETTSSRQLPRLWNGSDIGPTCKAVAVAVIIACASSVMDVAGKCWLAGLSGSSKNPLTDTSPMVLAAFIANAVFLVIMRAGTIYGCATCDVLLFVPINTMLNVILSVATGIVVLGEGDKVYSWVGLTFSVISVIGGILMLVTGPAEAAEVVADEGPGTSLMGPIRSFDTVASHRNARPVPLSFHSGRGAFGTAAAPAPAAAASGSFTAAAASGSFAAAPAAAASCSFAAAPAAAASGSFAAAGSIAPPSPAPAGHRTPAAGSRPPSLSQSWPRSACAADRAVRELSWPLFGSGSEAIARSEHECRSNGLSWQTSGTDMRSGGDSVLQASEDIDEAMSCIAWVAVHEALLRMNSYHQQAAQFRTQHQKEWGLMRHALRNARESTEESGPESFFSEPLSAGHALPTAAPAAAYDPGGTLHSIGGFPRVRTSAKPSEHLTVAHFDGAFDAGSPSSSSRAAPAGPTEQGSEDIAGYRV